MGNLFGKPQSVKQIIPSLEEEKKEVPTAAKARLLETDGGIKGDILDASQGKPKRNLFGN